MAAKTTAKLLAEAREEISDLKQSLTWARKYREDTTKERDDMRQQRDDRRDEVRDLRMKVDELERFVRVNVADTARLEGYQRRVRDCDRQELLRMMVKQGAKIDDLCGHST